MIVGKKSTTVKIYGKNYSLVFDGDEDHFNEVVDYLNEKMDNISKSAKVVDSIKVAVLAALKITDEYLTLKKNVDKVQHLDNEKAEMLIKLIDSNVEELRNC
ncbi:MAG: cell division protein ZapA [Candidatus Schekmanbacteria bacterium]|nr:MAG: cell division protein ZapA [Candidatus Schekmanbacteria bacterium]